MKTPLLWIFCFLSGLSFVNAQVADVNQYLMYFPFDNNLTDSSTQSVTLNPKIPGTVVDTYATGQFGQAALFNDKPYITANSTFDAGASFSMMMWVNFNSLSSAMGTPKLIHQEDQGPVTTFLAGRPLQVATAAVTFNTSFGERAINSPASPVVGTWTHIAVVMDKTAGTSKMYVDGVEVMTMNNTVGPGITDNKTNTAQLSIGVQKASSTIGLLNALVDDFLITTEVLDAATINNIITNGAASGGAPVTCITTTTFDGTSWDNGVPDANTAAVIAGNYALGAFTSCDLTVNNGITLDLGTAAAVIHGDLTNNGTILAALGSFEFASDGLQSLTGNDFQIGDLIINNSGMDGVELLSNVEVMNRLDLVDGILDTTAGTLTLDSNATKTAMVDELGLGSITGDVTVERFVPGKRAFRFLSSAVNTSTTINNNWQEGVSNTTTTMNNNPNVGFGTHITGTVDGSNGFDTTLSGASSMFGFDNVAQLWTTVTNTDVATLTAGTPYRLFVRGSRAVDLNSNTSTPDDTTLRATGVLQTGNVTMSTLGTTAGEFNFIGNPYQASVNMNSVLAASTNINTNFYYVWDPQLGARGSYVTVALPAGSNTSTSAANQFLQPGQAAFVTTLATGAANLLFQESHKQVGQNTSVFSTPSATSSLVGQLFRTSNGVIATTPQDSFGIFFNSTSNNAVDSADAAKIENQDESVSIKYGSDLLAIDNRQLPVNTEVIPLNHAAYRVDNYRYKIEIANITGKEVFLEDDFLSTSTLLSQGTNFYDFTVDQNNNSSALDRFSLRFENQTLSTSDEALSSGITLFPNPVDSDSVSLSVTNMSIAADSKVHIYNAAGQLVLKPIMVFDNGGYQIEGLSKLTQGIYFLRVEAGAMTSTTKLVKL